jgi:RNA polymerase sigma-70 factor (ECF subfamily)
VNQIVALPGTRQKERDGVNGPELLGQLFDVHHERLYRLARRLCRDSEDARDLVQEAFLRAARRPAAIPRSDAAAEAWFVTVLVNLARDRQRRISVRRDHSIEGTPTAKPLAAPNPESAAIARRTIEAALAHLSARRRAIVVLRDLEGLPFKRVGELLGISPVTVRWHHAAGRRQLAERLVPTASVQEEHP